MNKETFKKGEILHTKLEELICQREKVSRAKVSSDIIIKVGGYFSEFILINIDYLGFDKIKTFLLETMDKEIAKTQKEFDEL